MFISMDLSELRESTAASGPPEDSKDILSGRHDPNALKVFQSSHPFFLNPFLLPIHCWTIFPCA